MITFQILAAKNGYVLRVQYPMEPIEDYLFPKDLDKVMAFATAEALRRPPLTEAEARAQTQSQTPARPAPANGAVPLPSEPPPSGLHS